MTSDPLFFAMIESALSAAAGAGAKFEDLYCLIPMQFITRCRALRWNSGAYTLERKFFGVSGDYADACRQTFMGIEVVFHRGARIEFFEGKHARRFPAWLLELDE